MSGFASSEGLSRFADEVRSDWVLLETKISMLQDRDFAGLDQLVQTIMRDLGRLRGTQGPLVQGLPEDDNERSMAGTARARAYPRSAEPMNVPSAHSLADIDADILRFLAGMSDAVSTHELESAIHDMQHEISRQALVLRVHRLTRNGLVASARKGFYVLTPRGKLTADHLQIGDEMTASPGRSDGRSGAR